MISYLWENYEQTTFIFIEGKKMKVYITADHHFCHTNIIRYCNRPFSSVEEMNEKMIERWNRIVSEEDLVLHLGDFALANTTDLKMIREKLHGTIFLILGNHDRKTRMNNSGFIVLPTDEIRFYNLVLTHRPLAAIPDKYVNVHGHIHEKQTSSRRINASVDMTNFEPISIEKYFRKATLLLEKEKY